jgi:hypothetical protein
VEPFNIGEVMSKGSSPRPLSVPKEKFNNNFDAIFRKPDPRTVEDARHEDEEFERIAKQQNSQ